MHQRRRRKARPFEGLSLDDKIAMLITGRPMTNREKSLRDMVETADAFAQTLVGLGSFAQYADDD